MASTINLREVPEDVKAEFKAACARRGVTMQARLIELMRKDAIDNTKRQK